MMRRIMILFIALALMAGCTPNEPAAPVLPTATPTEELPVLIITPYESTATPLPTSVVENDSDECDNPFYPVSDGAVWEYDLSSGEHATHTMVVDENDAFTISIQGNASAFTIDGACTEEGIVLMDSNMITTTNTDDQGASMLTTRDASGVTLPKDIKINDVWSQTIHVTTGEYSSTIQTDYTAVGFENISVPAGYFYVLKIEQSGYVEIFGQKVDMHGYQWFAEGVGTVRSAMDGAPTAELVSYDIPD